MDSIVTGMAEVRGAYDGRPYAVSVPVMNYRVALPSPGGWRAADLAQMAILLLLNLAESLLRLQQITSQKAKRPHERRVGWVRPRRSRS
jgi:hypothetical protein